MARRHRIVTLLLLSAGCGAKGPATSTGAPPPEFAAEVSAAVPEPPTIRALTDADGYPLVGNVTSKGHSQPRPRPRPDGGAPTSFQAGSGPGRAAGRGRS